MLKRTVRRVAAIALISVAPLTAEAQDSPNPFFAIIENGKVAKVVSADTGEVAPVFSGKDLSQPPDCIPGGWYTPDDLPAMSEIIRCETGERYQLVSGGIDAAKIKFLKPIKPPPSPPPNDDDTMYPGPKVEP